MATPNPSQSLSLMDYTDTNSLQKGIGSGAAGVYKQGSDLLTTGKQTTEQGTAAFAPLISHFMKILKGDASEIDQEIQPEVSGVKDSYQAARDSITRSTPRGGGLASSLAANKTGEASQIANIRASARKDASGGLAQIGQQLLGAGLNEQSLGINAEGGALKDFGGLLQAAMKQDEDSSSFWGKIGGTIGAVAGSILFPPAAPALLGGAVGLWGAGGGGGKSAGASSGQGAGDWNPEMG
jgi:hypothetical protein